MAEWSEQVRDQSLITGRGTTKREGGASEAFPLQKGSCAKGGFKSFSHVEGGLKRFPSFKRVGSERYYPVSRAKSFEPATLPS